MNQVLEDSVADNQLDMFSQERGLQLPSESSESLLVGLNPPQIEAVLHE